MSFRILIRIYNLKNIFIYFIFIYFFDYNKINFKEQTNKIHQLYTEYLT